MFRSIIAVSTILAPGAAAAHVGHVGELAGHDHWIAIAAAGIAAAVWAAGKLKGKAKDAEEDSAEEAEPAGADA